ncbi:WSC domain-containing protein [Lactarius indigo]|nr:WSC domain-containing protein [Lactarius indigo]
MDDGQVKASSYQRINSTFIIPALVPSVGLWNGLGCYNDSVSARALQVRVDAGNTTVGSCVAACQAQGFSLAGVEFGRECWCGSQLQHGSAFFGNSDGIRNGNFRNYPDEPHCNMACQGDPSEICGGPALLNLYNFTGTYPIGASVVAAAGGWTSRGCYSDSVSSRTLELRIDALAGSLTVESCVAACQSQSFTIAGLEYAQECWCGNEIKSPGVPTSQHACNQACVGDSTEVCGGPNALQMYY